MIEVDSKDSKQGGKDEKHNPEVFWRAGVEDYVLAYPEVPGGPRLKLLTLDHGVDRHSVADSSRRSLVAAATVEVLLVSVRRFRA